MEIENRNALDVYLRPTDVIDSDHERIAATVERVTRGCPDDAAKAVALFHFVRDSIHYNAFMISVFKEDFRASRILKWVKGYCVCDENGLPVVEFDGRTDATLPEKDLQGRPYIEYLERFPPTEGLPFDWIVERVVRVVGSAKRPWLKREDEVRLPHDLS